MQPSRHALSWLYSKELFNFYFLCIWNLNPEAINYFLKLSASQVYTRVHDYQQFTILNCWRIFLLKTKANDISTKLKKKNLLPLVFYHWKKYNIDFSVPWRFYLMLKIRASIIEDYLVWKIQFSRSFMWGKFSFVQDSVDLYVTQCLNINWGSFFTVNISRICWYNMRLLALFKAVLL